MVESPGIDVIWYDTPMSFPHICAFLQALDKLPWNNSYQTARGEDKSEKGESNREMDG